MPQQHPIDPQTTEEDYARDTERYNERNRAFSEAELSAQRAAQDSLDTEARRIQASENLSYEAAYTKALAEHPDLYSQYVSGQTLHSFAEAGSTPAGLARVTAHQALLQAINTAQAQLQTRYPAVPRDLLLACVFDGDKALRQRCVAQVKLSRKTT